MIVILINDADKEAFVTDVQKAVNAIIDQATNFGWDDEAIRTYIRTLTK